MNNLTIDELSAYFPYGVKVRDNTKKVFLLVGIYSKNKKAILNLEGVTKVKSIIHIKPLLRPLSDLSKEIYHNGECFVPIDFINSEFAIAIPNKIELNQSVENRNVHFVLAEWIKLKDLFGLFNLLFKWHFDVFGLIDKGLADLIETEEQNG